MRKLGYRYQQTLAQPAVVTGVGYLSGVPTRLCFQPAPPHSGIEFTRTDLPGQPRIAARVDQVSGTQRRTTLGQPPAQIEMVEHVLAALAGLRIDNCRVELDAPEPPSLDGSALEFTEKLLQAGIVAQSARRAIWTVDQPVILRRPGATIAFHPNQLDQLRITYILDYGWQAPIAPQRYTQVITPAQFTEHLACCRTFLLREEALALRQQGIGAHATTSDLLVFGPHGPIDNVLRYADEPARHKVLDIVGDLSLFGQDLRGHVVAYRSGHPLNVELARTLWQGIEQRKPHPVAA
ncbi:MAG: UDP-3-O-acyl-N-acetylglucosamine deacetylase [Gemmataceae bacterium]